MSVILATGTITRELCFLSSPDTLQPELMEGVPQEEGFYFAKTFVGWRPVQVIKSDGDLITAGLNQPVEDYPAWSEKIDPPEVSV